jgi:thiol-disulfide isomerase/thioredoxin
MMIKAGKGWLRKHGGKIINVALVTLILLLIFVPDAKSWMMRQLMWTGIFNVRVDKQAASADKNISELGLIFIDTSGSSLSSESLKGKIVFINFWATWCPPCRAEMPSLNKLYKEFENDKDVVFLFVSEDEEPAKALDYLRSHQYKLPLYSTTGGATGSYYSGTLPTTLVFDKAGKLIHKQEGLANYHTSRFISTLRALQ